MTGNCCWLNSDYVVNRKLKLADPWYQLILRMIRSNILEDFHSKNVLEIGCGIGGFCIEMAKKCANVIGLDLSLKTIKKANDLAKKSGVYDKISFIIGDAHFLPFKERSCFITVCSETLEHVPKYERAFQQLTSVTEKSGYICVTVPNYISTQLLELCLWSLIGEGGHRHGLHIFHYLKVKRLFRRKDLEILDIRGTNFLHIPFFSFKRMEWNNKKTSNESLFLRFLRHFEKYDRLLKFFGSHVGFMAKVKTVDRVHVQRTG